MPLSTLCICPESALTFRRKSLYWLNFFGQMNFQNLELLSTRNVLQCTYGMYYMSSATKCLKYHNYLCSKIYEHSHEVDKWRHINSSEFLPFCDFDVYFLKIFSFSISLVVRIVDWVMWSCKELIKFISNVVWCKESRDEPINAFSYFILLYKSLYFSEAILKLPGGKKIYLIPLFFFLNLLLGK